MITSAHALNQLLSAIQQKGDTSTKFLKMLSNELHLTGDDAELRAATHLYRLVRRLKDDITALPFDEETKKQSWNNFAPFSSLLRFDQFNADMHSVRQTFLHPSALIGLTNLQGALWGHSKEMNFTRDTAREAAEIASELRDYIVEINTLSLPAHVRKLIHRRLDQISSMLENFFFYGSESIQEELEALVGTIILNSKESNSETKRSLLRVFSGACKAFALIAGVDKGLGVAVSILERGKKLWELTDGKSE